MSSTYGRKQKAAAMAACRWGNLEKVTVQDFECQVVIENRNLKDAETQTEISITLSYKLIAILRRQYHIILTASWEKIYSVLGGVAKRRSPIRNIFSPN